MGRLLIGARCSIGERKAIDRGHDTHIYDERMERGLSMEMA